MPAANARLRDLQARIARIERGGAGPAHPPLSLCPAIDQHLPEGGLARGALHEIQAGDPGAGLAFCALLLGCLTAPVLWLAPAAGTAWPAGLPRLGLRPERLLQGSYSQPADGLWAMEAALRAPALGGAVLQLERIDMTASRRLQLAAEGSERIGLLLRGVAEHGPSSAVTRWRITSLADPRLRPRWRVELLRCRAGRPLSWVVGWEDGEPRVEEAALARRA